MQTKYPTWYKILVYGMYTLIILTVFLILLLKVEQAYWEGEQYKYEYREPEGLLKKMRASWYDYKLNDDGKGVVCFMREEDCYTETHRVAASRDFPRGTLVDVCLVDKSRCVEVKITDYIEHPERDIDLSSYAFSQLTDLKHGLVDVTISMK